MDVPKDCHECQFTHVCKAWHFGGEKCVYEREIRDKLTTKQVKRRPLWAVFLFFSDKEGFYGSNDWTRQH